MGPVDSEASVSYLTLSVFAQSMVERLVDPPTETEKERRETLNRVVDVFRSIRSVKRHEAATAAGLRPFEDYGQVKTFYEVFAPSRDQIDAVVDGLVQFLEELRDDPSNVSETDRKGYADLFDKLATKALYRSRRPPESIPDGVRELCLKT